MAVEITVPQLGESITEAVVGKWRKAAGEPVAADEPVVTLETDKVTVDVSAPTAGTLERIAKTEGERVKVGELLATIAPGTGAAARVPTPTPTPTPSPTPIPIPIPIPTRAAATPVARKVAKDRGLEISAVPGTGPGGRVQKEDVLGYAKPAAPAPSRREERVPMTPLRKRVAERLLAAQSNAAILTTFNEVDMGAIIDLRKQLGDRFEKQHGVRLGFMSFFVAAALRALEAFPEVNAEIAGDEVVYKRYYDIGVAVSGSRGLVVPVLRDADRLSLADIERQIADYAERARTDRLTLADLQGGTFTLSNGGIFGSMLSTPILNPPQTGILGMHAIKDRPVAQGGQVVIRPMMYLALSYDHRLIDGREAVQFLIRIKDCVEDPRRLLLGI
ncbi:MAG: 2-oxoglutarate dehydrogenase complex dihydrolipoyllysine-residue succinyltransferase [Myxococcaceae bacterium]